MKHIFLIIMFFSIFFHLCAQEKLGSKYGIIVVDLQGKPMYKSEKKMLKYSLKFDHSLSGFFMDKREKFWVADSTRLYSDSYLPILPDSIIGRFKIIKIIEKKDNYQLVKNKLKQKSIFLIDIESIDMDTIPQFIRIISVDFPVNNLKESPMEEIKEGQQYQMCLYSFFEYDRWPKYPSDGVIMMRQPNQGVSSILFNNIWVVKIDISSWNFFETSNLKGLYYLPCK